MKKLAGALIALALGAGIIYVAPMAVAAVGLGYSASCHTSTDKCSAEGPVGDCVITSWTPTIVQDPADPLNSLLKIRTMVACDTPKAALKMGGSALYRFDCRWAPAGGWYCRNQTDVGLDNGHFHVNYCGKGNDAPSCVPFGWKYTSGQVIWYYDLKDKEEGSVTCHAFVQQSNGAFWFTDPDDMPVSLPEQTTYGQFYGDPTDGQACTGRRG